MTKLRFLALGSLSLVALLTLSGVSAGQQMVKLKTLKPEEFKQIHGTTDRYELMSMEIKGDCTQCHERRTETEVRIGAGYLFRGEEGGGETLRPYDLLDSHPVGEVDVFHRDPAWGSMNFLGEYLGEKYHSVDAEARYQGIADFAFFSRLYPHNQEHQFFPPATPESPVPLYNPDDQNPGADDSKDISEQFAVLRVGPQSYPAHVQVALRRYAVKGNLQQPFLDENCTTNCHNVSQTRSLDSTTASIQAGADAHAGYAGVSYTFDYTEFRDNENDPEWTYQGIPGVDPGGLSAHNTHPDMTQMDHTVTTNTMSSGAVAAWASYNIGGRKNEDSDVSEAFYRGLADVIWRPFSWVSVAAKYRRSHRQDDAGADVQNVRLAAGLPEEYAATTDRYSGVLTVQPLESLVLRGDFTHKDENRDDAAGFGETDSTHTNEWQLNATYRPVRRVTLRGLYDGLRTTDHPAFDTSPSDSRKLQAWASVQASSWLLLFANVTDVNAENRFSNFQNDQTALQAGFNVMPALSPFNVGAYYSYFKTKAERDRGSIPGDFLLVAGNLSYEALGTQYLLQIEWRPVERLTVKTEFAYITAEGSMDSSPADLGQWTDFKATQKDFSLDGAYEFPNGWGLSGRLAYSRYDQPDAEGAGEKITEGQLVLSKRW